MDHNGPTIDNIQNIIHSTTKDDKAGANAVGIATVVNGTTATTNNNVVVGAVATNLTAATTLVTSNNTNNHTTMITTNNSITTPNNNPISNINGLNNQQPQQQQQQHQIKSTAKQRHRGFLNQLLCCFRPPPSCAYHQDSIHSEQTSIFTQRFQGKYLLPPVKRNDKICMVIDLDETLVHSSFKPINNADFVVPVEIDGAIHQVYVLKRPHVDEFLTRMGQLYECVLFTASLAKYADPVADLLDKKNIFKARLFRESCAFYRGNYVKDLSRLGRDLNRVIIVDNSPASYIFHPDNAVPVASWFDDMSDTELQDLIPFLDRLSKADSIYSVLEGVKQNKLLSQINSSLGRPTQQLQSLPYAPTTH